jgi:predicted nucleotidyltransferase
VNTQHIAPIGFRWPVSRTLPLAIGRIVEAVDPETIILLGSYAVGTPTPDSDVDLLVVLETTATPAERYVAISHVLWPRAFPVDIVVRTPHEVRLALAQHDPFITSILKHGLVVYERSA